MRAARRGDEQCGAQKEKGPHPSTSLHASGDLLVTALTAGLVSPRSVIFEGVVVPATTAP